MKTILILEDYEERIADFTQAVRQLGDGYEVNLWRDAHSMCRECGAFFSTVALSAPGRLTKNDLRAGP